MLTNGRVVFGQMEEVRFGAPAAEAIAEQVSRMGAQRVFLMVSGTLNRITPEIENIRRALGNKCVGLFDQMPAHSPRQAVIAAAEQARASDTDLIITVGGGSITDAAKAVQLCLSNDIRSPEAMDALRTVGAVLPDLKPRPCGRSASAPRYRLGNSAVSPASSMNVRT
jgi:maleylacetate reductase